MSTPSFDKGPVPAGSYGDGPPTVGAPFGTPSGTPSGTPFGTPPPAYGAPSPGATSVVGPGGEWLGPPLASWGRRVAATLVDALVLLTLGLVVGGVLGGLLAVAGAGEGAFGLLVGLVYLGIFAFTAWQLVVQGRTGQTIGKRALGIRLVRLQDGQPVGPGLSIGRYFVHLLDAYSFLLGYLWPLWDKKNQTFADKCLSTVVLKV